MNLYLQLISFGSLAFLFWFESLGFIFRTGGVKVNRGLTGYTLQNSISFLSRFFMFLFSPSFAFLADTNSIYLGHNFLSLFFLFCLYLQLTLYLSQELFIKNIGYIIKNLEAGDNLSFLLLKVLPFTFLTSIKSTIYMPRFFCQIYPKIIEIIKSELVNNIFKFRTLIFSLSYLLFYSCWPIIANLINLYPSRPAFLISLATFFTLFTTITQVAYFDPQVSFIKDPDQLFFIYDKLLFLKIIALIFLTIFAFFFNFGF